MGNISKFVTKRTFCFQKKVYWKNYRRKTPAKSESEYASSWRTEANYSKLVNRRLKGTHSIKKWQVDPPHESTQGECYRHSKCIGLWTGSPTTFEWQIKWKNEIKESQRRTEKTKAHINNFPWGLKNKLGKSLWFTSLTGQRDSTGCQTSTKPDKPIRLIVDCTPCAAYMLAK